MRTLNVIDLFSGCGGFSQGFLKVNEIFGKEVFRIVVAVDSDPKVMKTYELNHPDVEFLPIDIRKLSPLNFLKYKIDIIIGSPPCDDFTPAKRNKNPKRGMILVNQFRKWVKVLKPKYWIMENVEGLVKYLDWFYPKKILLDAVFYGCPQNRERLFAGKFNIPFYTHGTKGQRALFGKMPTFVTVRNAIKDIMYIEPSKDCGIPNHVCTNSSEEVILRKMNCSFGMQKRYQKFDLDKPSLTITDMHGDSPPIFVNGKWRRTSVREVARLQGFDDDFYFDAPKSRAYGMVGRAVSPIMSFHLAKGLIAV